MNLVRDGNAGAGSGYAAGSIALGFVAVEAGRRAAGGGALLRGHERTAGDVSPLAWVGVGLAGGLGAVLRVVLTGAAGGPVRGTAAVNVTGAALLGLLVGAGADGDLLFVLGVGGLGSLTTFSTWMAEAHERRSPLILAVPLAAGLGAAALGRLVGTLL